MNQPTQNIVIEGREYRPVTLDEWMAQLQSDHPARAELKRVRDTAAQAMVRVDELERENSELSQQVARLRSQSPQPTPPPAPTRPMKGPFPEL